MISRLQNVLTAVFCSALIAAGAVAQPDQRLAAELVWYETPLRPGARALLGVRFDIAPRWHIQAGSGSGDEVGDTIPTTIELLLPDGWEADVVLWPKAHTFTIGEGAFAINAAGYDGRALAVIPVSVPASASPGDYEIAATVGYQACDDQICEPPTETTARTGATVVASGESFTPAVNEEHRGLFESVLSLHSTDLAQLLEPDEAIPRQPDEGAVGAAEVSRPKFFGIDIPRYDGPLGLLLVGLLAMAGGFILNLTPCVLPVIPIKIMTISQHAGAPGRSLVLGMWMALGVVAFWFAIGIPVAFVATITDPSMIFGIWWLTSGIGLLIGLMGLGIMGLFTIRLPRFTYAVNPKAETPWGSFAFGVMTAVLGLPCFGFVAGALLAGSATLPPVTVLVIFAALGIGMAAPYLVLAAKPSWVERIPRTGPASELVKQVMGLLLLAAAAYFTGSGLLALVSERPYLASQLHWWAVALFVTLAGFWLIVRTFQITKEPINRAVFTLIGIGLPAIFIAYVSDSTLDARSNWLAKQNGAAAGKAGDFVAGVWNDYSPQALAQAREEGYIVVLDFTAEWCLICKSLKAAVLNREPVSSELAQSDVVAFTVDNTSLSAPGWRLLRDLGQTGIPMLAIYSPGDDTPWMANAYTSEQVVAALAKARAARDDRP